VNKRWIGGLAVLAVLGLAVLAVAQDRKSQLRTVHGYVVNKEEAPLPNAIVYLKNLRTLTVRTHIANDEGRYRFSGLDPNVDYEIHAKYEDLTSATHNISTLDGRRDIVINLKVDKKKD
jgi:hypothetical protein